MSLNNKIIIGPSARNALDQRIIGLGYHTMSMDPDALNQRLLSGEEAAVEEAMDILSRVVDITNDLKEIEEQETRVSLN